MSTTDWAVAGQSPVPAIPQLQVSELLRALQAVRDGDFSVRLPGDWTGIEGKIADTFNEIVASNARMASELERVGTVVGKQGKTRQRVKFGRSSGAWGEMEASVNTLIDDLLWPTTEVTRALAAVAKGDLLQTVRLDVEGRPLEGEFLRSATIVNTMIEQLGVFTSEVTRVAREVGTDGKLGGQAQVRDVSGVWKDLTDSVNSMASNLTAQVRNISEVTIARRQRRPVAQDHGRRPRRDPAAQGSHQHDGRPAAIVRLGSDARRAGGRHRRPARRSGGGAGRGRHVEGPDRLGQRHGPQPDRPGAQHRRGDDGRRPRRPVAQDHGRRPRRDSRAEEHHQHDGRPAQRVRVGGDARGARGRHRRQARRPGAGARRGRHVEGPDRQRQLHGEQPHRAGAQHRRSGDGDCQRRPLEEDHGQRQRRDPAAQGNHQHDGRPAERVRRRGDARRARGRHRRAGSAARPRCSASPAPGRT